MSEFIDQHESIFWGLMLFVSAVGAILLSMTMPKVISAFLYRLRARRAAETETAPKGHFAELRESVERAARGY